MELASFPGRLFFVEKKPEKTRIGSCGGAFRGGNKAYLIFV